jgi:hypothetical protein
MHLRLSKLIRFEGGTVVIEYSPRKVLFEA